jgi:hypothetical protein
VRADGDRSRLRAVAPVFAAAIGVATVLVVVNQVSRVARASQAVAPVAAATQSDVPAVSSEVTEPSPVSTEVGLDFGAPPVIASLEPVASTTAPATPTPKATPTTSASVSSTPKPTTKPSSSASASTSGGVTSVGPAQASIVVVNGTDYAIHVVLDGASVTVPARGFGPPLLVSSTGSDTLNVTPTAQPTCAVSETGDFHLVAPHRYQLQIGNVPGCIVGTTDVGAPSIAGFTQTDG